MKKFKIIFLIILIISSSLVFYSCNKEEYSPINICIDGDIDNGIAYVDLKEFNTDDVPLKNILEKVSPLNEDYNLLITFSNGKSSLLHLENIPNTIISINNGLLSIKNISEITIISKVSLENGIPILTESTSSTISLGAAKMKLLSESIENSNELYYKDITVNEFLNLTNVVAYFKDYDIESHVDNELVSWKQGSLIVNGKPVFGFACGTNTTLMDFYGKMTSELDNNNRVMFILPDGFSLEQSKEFKNELTALTFDRATGVSLSVNRAISPVALATIVTGKSPYQTGIHFDENQMRTILKPNAQDIFEYATNNKKSVKYLEGNGNLIITSVEATYGLSDRNTYENALQAINQNKDFIFVHFHEIDDINHSYGPLSEESKTKCVEIDSYITSLISQFNGTIIIVPDHGHNTIYDDNLNTTGKHGLFTNLDMYIPYFIYKK